MPSRWQLMIKSERLEFVSKLIDEGYSYAAVAEELDEIPATISTFCRYYGIKSSFKRGAQPNNSNARVDGKGRTTIKRLTREVLLKVKRDLFKCERCNYMSDVALPRHHKDRNRDNNTPLNLEVLCNSCHALEHQSERDRDIEGRYV